MFILFGKATHAILGILPSVRAKREADAATALRSERSAREQDLGARAVKQLEAAMKANSVHAEAHKIHKRIGAMWMWINPAGALGYMIHIYVPDSGNMYGDRGHVALNFNINVARDEVHVLWKVYGAEETRPLEKFDELLERADIHVRNYRLFVNEGAQGPSVEEFFLGRQHPLWSKMKKPADHLTA